jgi:hypothetical protein
MQQTVDWLKAAETFDKLTVLTPNFLAHSGLEELHQRAFDVGRRLN